MNKVDAIDRAHMPRNILSMLSGGDFCAKSAMYIYTMSMASADKISVTVSCSVMLYRAATLHPGLSVWRSCQGYALKHGISDSGESLFYLLVKMVAKMMTPSQWEDSLYTGALIG